MDETSPKTSEPKRRLRAWQIFSACLLIISLGLLITLLIITTKPDIIISATNPVSDSDQGTAKPPLPKCAASCPLLQVVQPSDFDNPTVFQDLSPLEIQAVMDYLLAQTDLNISPIQEAMVNSSYIFSIDLNVPRKSEILEYLDRQQQKPVRSASAVLFRGDLDQPVVEEYIVSPLPRPTSHSHVPNNTYTHYPIPFDARPMSTPEYEGIEPVIDQCTRDLHELLVKSYGVGAHECDDKCLYFEDQTQINNPRKGRQTVYLGMRDVPGLHLHPIGIEIVIDHSGSDFTKWIISHIVYNNQIFSGTEDLMSQYRAGNLTIMTSDFPEDVDYSSFKRKGDNPSHNKRGPRMYDVDGPRYKVKGQHVEYMDWSFHFRVPPIHGVQLFDIRFKGERIAYEISPQEMSSFYSGHSLFIQNSQYLDLSFLFTKFEMVKGIDCPLHATYLDTFHLLDTDEVSKRQNVICIFEYSSGTPLMRHYANDYDSGYSFYGGVLDYYLVLRTISPVYNYDYIIDFMFHNNGAIHVKLAATGYLLATYNFPQEKKYGFPVHHNVMAPVHHHIYHFKVDLDIKGENNRFATYSLPVETIPSPWFPGVSKTQTFVEERGRTSELDARIFYDFDMPMKYVVYNDNSTNSFGSKRGYEIINTAMSKFLLPDEGSARSVRWAKYQLAVSQYKELETKSSSFYGLNSGLGSFVDFDQFLNNDESLVDEDLVVWLSMGTHHLPVSEDVPSVSLPGMTKSFYLRPFNYFDEDPSVSSRDAVHIVPGEEETVINTFGNSKEATCLPKSYGPLEYDGTW